MFKGQVFQFTVLAFGMALSPWIFTKLMAVIASHMHQRAIPVFLYLEDWLIRDLIRNWHISLTKYCLQTVQSLGFIPNLKKSDLIPAQKFMFIGMEFLTQQNIVRVLQDWVDSLLLTVKLFSPKLKFQHKLSFLFWWRPSWKSIFCFFSWTERPIDSKLARKHQDDL